MSPKDGGLISKGANEAIRVIRGLELSVLTQAWGEGWRQGGHLRFSSIVNSQ